MLGLGEVHFFVRPRDDVGDEVLCGVKHLVSDGYAGVAGIDRPTIPNLRTELLDQRLGAVEIFSQDNAELVSAETVTASQLSEDPLDALTGTLQAFVTEHVTVGVIDHFEFVHVEEQNGGGLAG